MADMYFHRIGLIDYLKEKSLTKFNSFYKGYVEAIKDVIAYESTEIQPVIYCKDCKHRQERHYEESGEKPYIKYECKFTKYSMSDDGFCSFGARMNSDTE